MNDNLISIIVPVYNVEKYLKRCINSILNQTYKNIELILVDDGSKDSSGAICDQYAIRDVRVKVIHKTNGGQASARNMALDIMSGNYVGFVDSDDYILPDMYASMSKALIENNADIAICGTINDHLIAKKSFQYFEGEQLYDKVNLMKAYLSTPYIGGGIWNKLYSAKLWEGIRFPILRAREDVAILHHIYGACDRAVHIGECKYVQYIRPGSTENKPFSKDLLVTVDIFQERKEYIVHNFPELQVYVELSQAIAYKSLLDNLLVGGKAKKELFCQLFESFCKELEKCENHNALNDAVYFELKRIRLYPQKYVLQKRIERLKVMLMNNAKRVLEKFMEIQRKADVIVTMPKGYKS